MSVKRSFHLRIPSDLAEQLETAAQSTGRSINSEVELRLRMSFKVQAATDALEERLAVVEKTLRAQGLLKHGETLTGRKKR